MASDADKCIGGYESSRQMVIEVFYLLIRFGALTPPLSATNCADVLVTVLPHWLFLSVHCTAVWLHWVEDEGIKRRPGSCIATETSFSCLSSSSHWQYVFLDTTS